MSELHCPTCKTEMQQDKTELVMRRGKSVVVIEDIPSYVCPQCNGSSIDKVTSQIAYEIAEKEINRGVSLEFCKYEVA